MTITPEFCTEKVIFWLDAQKYSVEHWIVVATDCHEKAGDDSDKAHELMKEALIGFHGKFRDAVVKPGNVLHDILCLSLDLVDWDVVAQSRFDLLKSRE